MFLYSFNYLFIIYFILFIYLLHFSMFSNLNLFIADGCKGNMFNFVC